MTIKQMHTSGTEPEIDRQPNIIKPSAPYDICVIFSH